METTQNHEIIITDDGSSTLRSPIFGELYHSSRGAVGEAQHVFIRFLRDADRVLEVGFGSGLNAWLALQTGLRLSYTTIELYPITIETATKLSYSSPRFMALHNAPWGISQKIEERLELLKIEGDLLEATFCEDSFDTIFFDAFAPDIIPEMWSTEIFKKLYTALSPSGQLLTYSAKGSVKQALRAAGFSIERLPGALGKRHMIRAIKG